MFRILSRRVTAWFQEDNQQYIKDFIRHLGQQLARPQGEEGAISQSGIKAAAVRGRAGWVHRNSLTDRLWQLSFSAIRANLPLRSGNSENSCLLRSFSVLADPWFRAWVFFTLPRSIRASEPAPRQMREFC